MSEQAKFGTVARDYALWRNDFPEQVYDQIEVMGIPLRGKKVVDIGCGTGVLSRGLAKRGAIVTGVDPSEELLAEAKKQNGDGGFVRYVLGTAEETSLPSNAFDLVTVLRAWHWFDRGKAIAEAKRLLKESGCLIVMDSGFHPKKPHPLYLKTLEIAQKYRTEAIKPAGSKAEATSRLLGFPKNWFDEWEAAGFEWIAGWQWEYVVPFSHEYWYGRIRTLSWYSRFPNAIRDVFDREIQSLLEEAFPNEPVEVPHLCSVVILKNGQSA